MQLHTHTPHTHAPTHTQNIFTYAHTSIRALYLEQLVADHLPRANLEGGGLAVLLRGADDLRGGVCVWLCLNLRLDKVAFCELHTRTKTAPRHPPILALSLAPTLILKPTHVALRVLAHVLDLHHVTLDRDQWRGACAW